MLFFSLTRLNFFFYRKKNFLCCFFPLYFMLCRAGKVNEIFFSRARCASSSIYILFSSSSFHFTIHISLYVDIFRRKRMKEKKWKNNKRAAEDSRRFFCLILFFADFFFLSFCFYEFCFRCFLCNIFLLLMLFEATILFLMLLFFEVRKAS